MTKVIKMFSFFWQLLSSLILFVILGFGLFYIVKLFFGFKLKNINAQMAKQLDAAMKICSTEVGTSANLVLGTIDDYILLGKIVLP